ncbi:MAG: fumarylacetoacetate hydrolase family protein [Dehalococcoidia bacterium]
MKLAYFDDYRLGVVKDDHLVDVTDLVQEIPHVGPHDLISRLIEAFDQYRPRLEQAAAGGEGIPAARVRFRAPLPRPGKMVCMAGNFLENGTLKEPRPINAFLKNPDAVIGDGDTIHLPDAPATIFHHEAELGLVIGRKASRISEDEAYGCIFGFVNFIDVSARGIGPVGADTFLPGKSWHTFAPMGPFLVTADDMPDPKAQDTPVRLWVNGELHQDYSTSDIGHSVPKTLAWISSITTLNPGDLVALGTNHQGLGALQDGDEVVRETPGLGRLTLHVSDPLGREWPRGIDQEMADRIAGRTR